MKRYFSTKCVRTLDRCFDANDYYRYVIYKEKTCNIMDVEKTYKDNYVLNFKDKRGKMIPCKMSFIPVRLCEFPTKELTLVAVYGFGAEPMLLLSNLRMHEKKKLCQIITKVYLMR